MVTERWLLAAYACSGFAGLVYQIAWTRLLILHLGHTTAAVSTVTAAFMGGLGLGGALGGRVASRLSRRQALWTYALLELVVALAAAGDRRKPDSAHAVVRMGVRRGRHRPCLLDRAGLRARSQCFWYRASRSAPRFQWPCASPSHPRHDRAGRPAGCMAPTRLAPRSARWWQASFSSRCSASRARR